MPWSNNSNSQSTNVSPSITTTYVVTVTDTNNCSATDNVQVTVKPLPPAEAGLNLAICYGDSTTLNASGGVNYVWNPTTSLSNPNIANPISSPASFRRGICCKSAQQTCHNKPTVFNIQYISQLQNHFQSIIVSL